MTRSTRRLGAPSLCFPLRRAHCDMTWDKLLYVTSWPIIDRSKTIQWYSRQPCLCHLSLHSCCWSHWHNQVRPYHHDGAPARSFTPLLVDGGEYALAFQCLDPASVRSLHPLPRRGWRGTRPGRWSDVGATWLGTRCATVTVFSFYLVKVRGTSHIQFRHALLTTYHRRCSPGCCENDGMLG